MKKIQDLYDFVDRAIKSRKYPDNTGMALKSALKLFEAGLNEEEKNSVVEFKKNLDQIYQSVFSKNKNFSATSLATYKSRVTKVLNDFEKYGTDPTKMANWSPKIITRAKKSSMPEVERKESDSHTDSAIRDNSFHSFDFTGGMKLIIPKNSKTTEAIMDGELKQIKVELKKFADTFCEEKVEESETDEK
jgi:soluble cytochrome b562